MTERTTEPRGLTVSDGQARLVGLDGLRGVAILLVFLVHWTLAWSPRLPPDSAWAAVAAACFAVGNAGVDLFFALSGLLIYDHYLARPTPAGRFMFRRAWRVYPAYLAVFALYLGLALAVPRLGKVSAEGVDALYLLRCVLLLPGLVQEQPLVGVAWSLSYEIAFYLFLPPFVLSAGLRRRAAAGRVAAVCLAAALLLASALATGLHERLLLFPAGMLAREFALARPEVAAVRQPWPFLNPGFGGALACAAIGAVAFGLAIPASIQRDGPLAALCRIRPLRFMGEVSYSFYLLHNLAIRVVLAAVPAWAFARAPAWAWAATLPLGFAVALVPGLGLYRFVERPCLAARPQAPGPARPGLAAP